MSPASQNELTSIIAKYIIQIRLIEEFKKAKCCSISLSPQTKLLCIYVCVYMYMCICWYVYMYIDVIMYIGVYM